MEMNGKQKVFYQKMVSEVKGTVEAAYRNNTAGQAGIIALTALLRLRQICASPAILDKTYKHPSPKMEFLAEKLLELQGEGHASLVFSQFTAFLDLCEVSLKKADIKYIRMDGKTPTEKRKDLVREFQTGEKPCVFLISLKTGGVGLNLTRAGYVFHLDPWWNPAVENQASDRAHRMGQKQTVMVTRLLMKHTIEEKMMLLKDKKKQLFNEVMNESLSGEKVTGGVLSRDDFEFLIS
jgi:non-specific serine/threonine protein kinase